MNELGSEMRACFGEDGERGRGEGAGVGGEKTGTRIVFVLGPRIPGETGGEGGAGITMARSLWVVRRNQVIW